LSERPPGIGGIVGQLFAYIDRPWKAFAVVGVAAAAFLGWLVYESRNEVLEAWLTPSEVSLKTDDVPHALEKLVEDSGADLAQIWSVDLGANSQRFLGARRKDGGRPVIPEPRRLPIIVHVSDIKVILDVINGRPVCTEVTLTGTPFARRLAERGFRRGCAIPIPPGPSAFVGVIYLAWIDPPEESQETVAVGAAREIAGTLVNR
jgi:hypothetical protein